MNKEAMKQLILESLSKKLGDDYHISIQKVLKTNISLDGLTIMENGKNIAQTIYMEPFYEELENGASIHGIVDRILQDYSAVSTCKMHFDIASLNDFGYIKDRLYVELINKHFNRELLANVPHSWFLDDFAVTVRCLIETSTEGNASFLIHNNYLEAWHIDHATLLSLAIQNTRKLLGLDLRSMNDIMAELNPDTAGDDDNVLPIWVMTNKQNFSGAATALFDDVLKDFAKEHGNFYIIFSSVHEVLLLLESDRIDIDCITEINQQVNATQLRANEVLGTKAYYYSKDSGFLV